MRDVRKSYMRVHRERYLQDCLEVSNVNNISKWVLGLAKNYLGHESLLDAKIHHRDISVGNVMLYGERTTVS